MHILDAKRLKKPLLIAALLACQHSYASKNAVTIKSQDKINQLISSIPAQGGRLDYVLSRYGLRVSSILLLEADDADINDGSFMYKKGDKFIDIYLKTPIPSNAQCEIWQPITLLLRKRKYLPQSRTSNFLLKGKCVAPD